jgi:hypothetical protein
MVQDNNRSKTACPTSFIYHQYSLFSKSKEDWPQLKARYIIIHKVTIFSSNGRPVINTTVTAITATLQAQNSTFISLAGKTAELDAELQKIKSVYRELWRSHTGSARDPFNEIDRRPRDGGGMLNGIGSLNLSR